VRCIQGATARAGFGAEAEYCDAIMCRMALTFSADFVSGGPVTASDVCGSWCAYRLCCCCPLAGGAG